MKKMTAVMECIFAVLLAACGSQPGVADVVSAEPWPSHAPDATPYVRLQSEAAPSPEEESEGGGDFENMEDFLRSIYAEEGSFYAKDWEMQMFRELPQDEPYNYVVHTDAMLRGEDTAEDHIRLAEQFAGLGCEARVKEMHAVYEGKEEVGWVTIVTTSPAHLWELSDEMGQPLHIEQLYPQVDARFESQIWPEGQDPS